MSKRIVVVFAVLACSTAIFAAGQQVGAAGSEFAFLPTGWAATETLSAAGGQQARDAMPLGRSAEAIVDGQYPAT